MFRFIVSLELAAPKKTLGLGLVSLALLTRTALLPVGGTRPRDGNSCQ